MKKLIKLNIYNIKLKLILLFLSFVFFGFLSLFPRLSFADTNLSIRAEIKINAINFDTLPNAPLANQPLVKLDYRIQKKSYNRRGRALDGAWITWYQGQTDNRGEINYQRNSVSTQNRRVRIQVRPQGERLRVLNYGVSHGWITVAELSEEEMFRTRSSHYVVDFGERSFHPAIHITRAEAEDLESVEAINLFNDENHLLMMMYHYGQMYVRYYDSLTTEEFSRVDIIYPWTNPAPDIASLNGGARHFAPPVDLEGMVISTLFLGSATLPNILSFTRDNQFYFDEETLENQLNSHDEIGTWDINSGLDESFGEIEPDEYINFRKQRFLAKQIAHEMSHIWYGQITEGRFSPGGVGRIHQIRSSSDIAFFEGLGLLIEFFWYQPFANSNYSELANYGKKSIVNSVFIESEITPTLAEYSRFSYGNLMILRTLLLGDSLFDYDYSRLTGLATDHPDLFFYTPLPDGQKPRDLLYSCPDLPDLDLTTILSFYANLAESEKWLMHHDYGVFEFFNYLVEHDILTPIQSDILYEFSNPELEFDYTRHCEPVFKIQRFQKKQEAEPSYAPLKGVDSVGQTASETARDSDVTITDPTETLRSHEELMIRIDELRRLLETNEATQESTQNTINTAFSDHEFNNALNRIIEIHATCPLIDEEDLNWFLELNPIMANDFELLFEELERRADYLFEVASWEDRIRRSCSLTFENQLLERAAALCSEVQQNAQTYLEELVLEQTRLESELRRLHAELEEL